jgi:hypothetical protein
MNVTFLVNFHSPVWAPDCSCPPPANAAGARRTAAITRIAARLKNFLFIINLLLMIILIKRFT